MREEIILNPPVIFRDVGGDCSLSTVAQVIDYLARRQDQTGWEKLRNAAFVAAAEPSPENIGLLRHLAEGSQQVTADLRETRLATINPYDDPSEQEAWNKGYGCYRPLTRDGGDAFTALWAALDKATRGAAYDGWICAIIDDDRRRAISEIRKPADVTNELADEFAKEATRDILAPDHGFSVTEALSQKLPPSRDK